MYLCVYLVTMENLFHELSLQKKKKAKKHLIGLIWVSGYGAGHPFDEDIGREEKYTSGRNVNRKPFYSMHSTDGGYQ